MINSPINTDSNPVNFPFKTLRLYKIFLKITRLIKKISLSFLFVVGTTFSIFSNKSNGSSNRFLAIQKEIIHNYPIEAVLIIKIPFFLKRLIETILYFDDLAGITYAIFFLFYLISFLRTAKRF